MVRPLGLAFNFSILFLLLSQLPMPLFSEYLDVARTSQPKRSHVFDNCSVPKLPRLNRRHGRLYWQKEHG